MVHSVSSLVGALYTVPQSLSRCQLDGSGKKNNQQVVDAAIAVREPGDQDTAQILRI